MADHDNRTPPMLPDEVRMAVRSLERELADPEDCAAWGTIKAHLLAREAEVADADRILRSSVPEPFKGAISPVGGAQGYIAHLERRCEHAEALLRECHARLSTYHPADRRLADRITAHFSENSRG